jgi:multiple sugar transport system substrate-binding protein
MTQTTRRLALRSLATAPLASAGIMIAACGQQEQAPGAPAGKPSSAGSQLRGAVTFWAINAPWGQMSQGEGGRLLADFRAKHPQLAIEVDDVVPSGPSSVEKLHTAAAAGTMPDLFMANRGYAAQLGAEGLSRPLDAYLKQSRALPRNDLWESHLEDASWKGQLYAITHSSGVWVLFVNRQLWQESGLDPDRPPKTWAELEDAARKATRMSGGEPDRVGYHPTWGNAGNSLWLVHYRQTGGDYFTSDWRPAFVNDDRVIGVFSWMKGFVDRQGGMQALEDLRKQVQASIGSSGAGIFASNRIASLIDSHTIITDLEQGAPDVHFSVAPLPLPPGGRQSGWQGGADLHLAKDSRAPDAGWAIIEHLMAPENILAFALALSRIPSRKSVGQSKAYLEKSPYHKFFVEVVPASHNVPIMPGNFELAPIISGITADILAGKRSVREALSDAAQQTSVVVEKWRRYLT